MIPTPPGKSRITIRLDDDILEWFREQVHRAGGGTAEYGDFEKVIELFVGLDSDEKILADVDAGIEHLRSEGFALEQIGLVGFCFGGRVSFLAALNRPIGPMRRS